MASLTLFLCGVGIAFASSLALDEAVENYRLKKKIESLEKDIKNKELIDEVKEFNNNE